jgi:penicillin-binding protein 2
VIGYTSPVDEEELGKKTDLLLTDYTGKTGIERQYDDILRGSHGVKYVEVDAKQRPQKTVGEKDPIDGQDLKLTIDSDLQEFVFSVLAERAAKNSEGKVAAAAIVMEVESGEVLALVNYPSFDANSFSQPSRKGETADFLKDDITPLFNRAVSGTYAPGSTIKPFLAAAALQEGIINSRTKIISTGGIQSGSWFFPDWKAGGHGETDVYKAIAESVNTFFYVVMGGDDESRGLGVEKAKKYLAEFSWGGRTGVDLPAEAKGLLPDPKWKREVKHEQWYIGDTYHFGIGQGDVLVTPLQVSAATAGIANRGVINRPFMLKSVTKEGREQDKGTDKTRVTINKSHMATVKEAMRKTVTDGSAVRLSTLPWALAGKTGTAQASGGDDTHAWFTSFGPYEEPRLVVTVMLERGGEGDKDAVPVAEEIWGWLIENY